MARNQVFIDASLQHVFDVLADPYSYPEWVIGTKEVTDADPGWPKPVSRFDYRTWGGVTGSTEVVEADPPRMLMLTTVLPVGRLQMEIDLVERDAGTEVHLEETIAGGLARPVLDAGLHARNAATLLRLKTLIEKSQVPDGAAVWSALSPRRHRLDDQPYRDILQTAERCYLAITTSRGPHVTPVAFVISGGRLWIVIERASVKAKAVRNDPRIGILVRDRERSVVIQGRGVLLDPARALMPEHLVERIYCAPAMVRYVMANNRRLGGYLTGGLRSLIELNPAGRLLLAISMQRVVSLEGDAIVSEHAFAPLARPPARRVESEPLDLDHFSGEIADMASEPGEAVLAWDGNEGPLALPAFWDPEQGSARVPAALLEGSGGRRAALCLDRAEGYELERQIGVVVRGTGRVSSVEGDVAKVVIDQEKTTAWEGGETATV